MNDSGEPLRVRDELNLPEIFPCCTIGKRQGGVRFQDEHVLRDNVQDLSESRNGSWASGVVLLRSCSDQDRSTGLNRRESRWFEGFN